MTHPALHDAPRRLARLIELAEKLGKGEGSGHDYPVWVTHGGQRALVDHFWPDTELARTTDAAVLGSKTDAWVGHALKEKKVRIALAGALSDHDSGQIAELLDLVKARSEYH